ncbi:MAG: hypothetical protein K8I60_10275 [Anaerolineae bacterium]|nr:hypothetical protein [Anaerolineae bacterium]
MPVCDMRFENGIFYSRQVGEVDTADAQEWVAAMQQYAGTSADPIVMLIDACEATVVTPAASLVLLEGSATPNIAVAVIVANSGAMQQRSQVIGMMSEPHSSHPSYVFTNYVEAEKFARRQVRAQKT